MSDLTVITDNIVHSSKHVQFGGASGLQDWVELGVDWSAATFVMTLAEVQGGAAVVTLNNASAGTQGISASYDASYDYTDENGDAQTSTATVIRPQIDEATFEALSGFPAAPDPYELVYQLLVTPTGEPQRVIYEGTFTINHGVGD